MTRPLQLTPAEMYATQPDPRRATRRRAFQTAFAKRAGLWLREQGFAGKGPTLRRFRDPFLHVINLQPWKHGGGVALNLGIHFRLLPRAAWLPPWEEMDEAACALRWRVTPQDGADFWWRHGDDDAETHAVVEHLFSTLLARGVPWFDDLGAWPGIYPRVSVGSLPLLAPRFLMGVPVLPMAWVLAHHGAHAQAMELLAHEEERVRKDPAPPGAYALRVREEGVLLKGMCGG